MTVGLYVMLSVWAVIALVAFTRKVYFFGKYRGAKELHQKLVDVAEEFKKEEGKRASNLPYEGKHASKRPYIILDDYGMPHVDARYVTYHFDKHWNPSVYHN